MQRRKLATKPDPEVIIHAPWVQGVSAGGERSSVVYAVVGPGAPIVARFESPEIAEHVARAHNKYVELQNTEHEESLKALRL